MLRRRLPHHEVWRHWTEYAEAVDLAPRTIESYRRYLSNFEADMMVDLLDATAQDVLRYVARQGNRGPSKGAAKRALRHFYRFAKITNLRPDDPSAVLPPTKTRRRSPDWFVLEEAAQLLYAAVMIGRSEWAWGILFVLATGARIGEACRVRPADVDLTKGIVTVRRTKNGDDRDIILGPTARAAYLELVNGREYLLGVSPAAMRDRMKKVARAAGLPVKRVHPHALRHTYATILAEEGATREELMAQMGWRDGKSADLYIHLTRRRLEGVAARF